MLDKKKIKIFSLINKSGAEVVLSNLGAGIVSIVVPDKNGKMDDVALGYDDLASYYDDGPFFGKIPGRCANRIAKGKFTLDGKEYSVTVNNGPNHNHGGNGEETFANRLWEAEQVAGGVKFSLDSKDMDAGYPGAVHVEVFYSWSETNDLAITITAETDSKTIVNPTNHVYFNLKGESAGDMTDHFLTINASNFLETDQYLVPTGKMIPVKDTPMDFTKPKQICKQMNDDYKPLKYGKGYDHCFVIDNWDKTNVIPVAELYSEQSGRKVTVSTNSPGIMIYGGNWLAGCPKSKSGKDYKDYDGVAMECQWFPDSINHENFPSVVLEKGEQFENKIIFTFGISN